MTGSRRDRFAHHTVLGGILVHRTERARTIESRLISKRKELKAVERTYIVAGIIVTALIVAVNLGPTSGLAADGTIKVGVIEMLTGGSAFYGNAVLEGIKVAEAEINASGGIAAKKVQLAIMDNASDNAQAATLTAQLASDKSIPVGITPTYQPNFNAACARANAAGFPLVSAPSGPPDPTNNPRGDRKSTRLNSSHLVISYAVFC